jgi:hypothetical protein
MNTQTKVTGVLATLLVLSAAPMPSYAVTTERGGAFQLAVQQGVDSRGLLVAVGQRGGGGGRSAGGGNRGGGGGGAAAANRGGGGGAAAANRGGGQRQVRSQATSNVNHNRAGNANVNNSRAGNANVNNNRNNIANNSGNRNINNVNNVNVNGDFDNGWNGGWDDDYHPFAAAAVIGGTAALVGSMVNSVPPSCTPVVVDGLTYSQCGSTWYQPQYAGTTVQYEVVNPPQ